LRDVTCYSVDRKRVAAIADIAVTDRFGQGTADLRRPTRLCAPADVAGEDATAPADPAHLLGYELAGRSPRFAKVKNVTVSNDFGAITVEVIRPVLLMLPTRKSRDGDPGAPTGIERPPVQCYATKGGRTRRDDVTVTDQFGSLVIDVKAPFRLCTAASLSGGDAGVDALMCYRVRQTTKPRFKLTVPLFVHDVFAARDIVIKQPTEVCIRSTVQLP
jgi:hypothetical protein